MIKKIAAAYEVLKKNRDYWTFDNDYRTKFRYIEEVATTNAVHSQYSLEYICDIADFMLKANKRIFG